MDTDIHHPQDSATEHNHRLHKWMLGTALVAGAVVLSPYLLPYVLPATADLATVAETAMLHGGVGQGVVGLLTKGLGAVPLMGAKLAEGGLTAAAVSGLTGAGGVLLGRFVEKKQNGKNGINWGKVIKYSALIASALVALPPLLTAIGTGLYFLSMAAAPVIGTEVGSTVLTFLHKYIGAASMNHAGMSTAAMTLPHLFTCGAALLPAAFSMKLASNKEPQPKTFAERVQPQKTVPYSDGQIVVQIQTDKPTVAGQPCHAKLRLIDCRTGAPIPYDELAVVHTRKLHLFVADQSLKDYTHIHPEPTGEPGVLEFTFTPKTSNQYAAWAEFTLLKDGNSHRIKTEFPAQMKRSVPAVIRANESAEQDGLVFNWQSSNPLQNGAASIVEVNVTDSRGNPVTDLEPVMGAFAHLVGFSADGKTLIHTHPLGTEPDNPNERGGPRLRFHVEPSHAGATQFYLQVKRGGQDIYIPFGQQIKPPALASENVHVRHHHPTTYAMNF